MTATLTRNTVPIPILTYHQVAQAGAKGTPFRSLSVSPADFERQMAFLHLLGYQGLSMSALLPYLQGEKSGRVVGITFDDGFLNNLTHAQPVLARYGFSSTCYVVSQLMGKTNVWDHEAGIPPSDLMNVQQLRQWAAGGQEVGAHTRHHVHLMQLDDATCIQEIALCKTELENAIEGRVDHFCYPYGEFDARHAPMVLAAGYRSATTTQRSRCQSNEDMVYLPRVPVVRTTTRMALWLKLATRYEDRRRA